MSDYMKIEIGRVPHKVYNTLVEAIENSRIGVETRGGEKDHLPFSITHVSPPTGNPLHYDKIVLERNVLSPTYGHDVDDESRKANEILQILLPLVGIKQQDQQG